MIGVYGSDAEDDKNSGDSPKDYQVHGRKLVAASSEDCPQLIKDAEVLFENEMLLCDDQYYILMEVMKKYKNGRYHRKEIRNDIQNILRKSGKDEKEINRMAELLCPYGMIKTDEGLYAIYRDNKEDKSVLAGTGNTSNIKFVQNQKTGKWRVLKNMRTDKPVPFREDWFDNEYQILKILKRIDPFRIDTKSRPREGKAAIVEKHQIIMDIARGYELYELIIGNKQHLLPKDPEKLKQIAINILKALIDLHQKGILVIDIKIENIMVDPDTLEVTFIDFNGSKKEYDFKKDMGSVTNALITPACLSPENFQRSLRAQQRIYNKAGEIYSIGVALRELLFNDEYYYNQERKIVELTPGNPRRVDDKRIESLLMDMTSIDPEKRPSLEYAVAVIESTLVKERKSEHPSIRSRPLQRIKKRKVDIELTNAIKTFNQSYYPSNKFTDTMLETKMDVRTDKVSYDFSKQFTDDMLKNAMDAYETEKNRFFGLRWSCTSYATLKAASRLSGHKKQVVEINLKDLRNPNKIRRTSYGRMFYIHNDHEYLLFHDIRKNKYYYYDHTQKETIALDSKQDGSKFNIARYNYVTRFITQNPHTTFAKKLACATNDEHLKSLVKAAIPWWRRWCSGL